MGEWAAGFHLDRLSHHVVSSVISYLILRLPVSGAKVRRVPIQSILDGGAYLARLVHHGAVSVPCCSALWTAAHCQLARVHGAGQSIEL